MLEEYATGWITLGEDIAGAELIWITPENFARDPQTRAKRLNDQGKSQLAAELKKLLRVAEKLNLPVSQKLLGRRIGYTDSLPATPEEFRLLVEALKDEVSTQLFFYVPPNRAPYYDDPDLTNDAYDAFPDAYREIKRAGNCYAFGESTAAVFHSMRAAEICVRVLGTSVGATFSAPIELMEWQIILNAITPKIRDIENQPKSTQRDADLEFYGTAAAQLRYFKNGWRIHVAHAGVIYEEAEAKEAIDHVRALIETLSKRLYEPDSLKAILG
jgi:hypothetical protein